MKNDVIEAINVKTANKTALGMTTESLEEIRECEQEEEKSCQKHETVRNMSLYNLG